MKVILRVACAALAIAVIAADPPAPRFLLLESRQLLEGEIERTPDGFRVRRNGGESLIPSSRVVALCEDRVAAYRLLSEKIKPSTVDDRLALAQWCHHTGLSKEAVAEAKAAVELRPNHAIAQRFLKFYEQAAAQQKPPAPTVNRVAEPPGPLPELVDCSPEALQHFCTKVQPVLMNACAGCHASTPKVRMQRVYSDSMNGRPAAFQNLATIMPLVDRVNPSASPLLKWALTAHGGSPAPPIRDRGTPAFQQLETWARMLSLETSSTPVPPPPEAKSANGETGFAGDRAQPPPAQPRDPFDPADFNRKNHPDKP
jgi:hypothetical protein